MADQITANPNAPRDWTGDIVPGALLYTYVTGTTTPLTVFRDVDATLPHPNPIEADANGVFPQIFFTGVVKGVATDPDGVVLPGFPLDPMPRSVVGTSGASTISFLPTAEIPETNVQGAIERVQENLETTLGTGGGVLVRNGAGVIVPRTLTAGLGIIITDGAGAAANPTIETDRATKVEAEAGLSGSKTMTPLRVEEHMLANAIGWGQTAQDVTGTRAIGTSYQNTTGRPIFIRAELGDGIGFEVSADNTTWVAIHETDADARFMAVSWPIPQGHYYRMTGSGVLRRFVELR